MRLSGLVSHRIRRTFMNHGNGVSRGDRNRNARLKKLRAAVPVAEQTDEVTLECPACGYAWEPGPPVLLKAA